jgi:acetoin utilization deacetylase AcuC-like enzyme
MDVVYSPRYGVDIGTHVFPTGKYRLIHDRITAPGEKGPRSNKRVPGETRFVEPEPATWEELALVHTSEYLDKLRYGSMTSDDLAQLELPWSIEVVECFRLMVGGTIVASRLAVEGWKRKRGSFSVVCHLGGGLHHAFPNHGEGFCPFNDIAIAARVLQAEGVERHAVIDLDVHHGNGTAFIFESDPRVFTFSMHQQHNYPMWKPRGSLDVGLPDGVHDATYLREVERALPQVLAHRPDCAFYLAGADPYEDDQLGGLRLTKDGLRRRDRTVMEALRAADVPLVVTLAGGYARQVDDTVAIHCATIEEAAKQIRGV